MYSIKFKVGTKVYPIYSTSKTATKQCEVCEGAKNIFYRNRLLTCPECRGTGKTKYEQKIWSVGEPRIIQAIHVRKDEKITCEFTPTRYSYCSSYVDQEHAFINKQDAQEICNILNNNQSH